MATLKTRLVGGREKTEAALSSVQGMVPPLRLCLQPLAPDSHPSQLLRIMYQKAVTDTFQILSLVSRDEGVQSVAHPVPAMVM